MEQTQTTTNTPLLRLLSNQMADAVERIGPALALVYGRPRQPASGVVYGQDLVLTADHVLERTWQPTWRYCVSPTSGLQPQPLQKRRRGLVKWSWQ